MFTVDETHKLLRLHEKLHNLNKLLHKTNLDKEVFEVDLGKHQQEVKDIKDEILGILAEIGEAKANMG
jgi:predicted  nucleic acid-binding Zn-ribbon protein